MNQDLSIVTLLIHASWVVQAVVALLIGISIASWAAIFRKVVSLKRAQFLNAEFDREFWSGHISDAGTLLDGARRAMRASYQREMDAIESNLSFLATVGSVSPYVGLFGTVWGIMHAFTGLAAMESVTLATVAPGIAEALVATAIALFAAIPAVVAYNRFAHDIDRIANRLETFIEEFSNILQRNLGAQSPSGH